MHYHISRKSICSQYIQIKLLISCHQGEPIHLQLAAWRPGRYELTNYAQKIRGFQVKLENKPVYWYKKTKDLWFFTATETGEYQIDYEFYCNQMDAGGCWSDDRQLYLNFSNFVFEVKEKSASPISVSMDIPEDYQVATALPENGQGIWEASGYQHLMDSPLLAAAGLQHQSYSIQSHTFHLWFHGDIHFDMPTLIEDFKAFTEKQIMAFGEFPAENYHFIFQLLPYRHYHGVEHAYSTVITYGPAEDLKEKAARDELMGVSSHELYHFWNVCRIRPKELCTYNLATETYLDTGLVLEGVTSYMGDLFLLQSGYFSKTDYLKILQKQIQKEADHEGWKNLNIQESSFDLWLDGYKPGIPDRKVSIYNRGALIALCLDIILLPEGACLSAVMKKMWDVFGRTKMGYHIQDFYEMLKSASNNSTAFVDFWDQYVVGKGDLLVPLSKLLDKIGIAIIQEVHENEFLHNYGIRKDEEGKVLQVHQEADAYGKIMINDLIVDVPSELQSKSGNSITIGLERLGRKLNTSIQSGEKRFYPLIKLQETGSSQFGEIWEKGQ